MSDKSMECEAVFLGADGKLWKGRTTLTGWRARLIERHRLWGIRALPLLSLEQAGDDEDPTSFPVIIESGDPEGADSMGEGARTENHLDPEEAL
jgi:hypothetical protein